MINGNKVIVLILIYFLRLNLTLFIYLLFPIRLSLTEKLKCEAFVDFIFVVIDKQLIETQWLNTMHVDLNIINKIIKTFNDPQIYQSSCHFNFLFYQLPP